mmetsp:Transcript_91551/g.144681  ORF Transcript_91551/g.144681 Transcript_91551/m.144681 type:complete len:448 (+) Transcript_91551:68-1411(+)
MSSWFGCRCEKSCRGGAREDEITAERSERYIKVEEQIGDTDPLKGERADAGSGQFNFEASTTYNNSVDSQDTDGPDQSPATIRDKSDPNFIVGKSSSRPSNSENGSPQRKLSVGSVNSADLPEDVRTVLEQADSLRIDGFHFTAESSILELINRLTAEGKTSLIEKVRNTQIYLDLIASLGEVNGMLQALLDDEGWSLQKEADRIWVWTKPEPGKDVMTVRIAGIVEGPFDYFCSIGKEVGLIKTWMPGVNTSYLVKQLNTFDHIGYYVWKFPLVSAREFLVEEHSIINDAEGYCLVRRHPPIPRDDVQLPTSIKGSVRAGISNWYSFSAPCGQRSIFAITVMNVDLKIPLPGWLVNRLSINMGYQSFKELRNNVKKAMDPKSQLHKSVKDPTNSDYYDRLRGLENIREKKDIPCREEILKTGWVKDPTDRRRIFSRSGVNVLVPLD